MMIWAGQSLAPADQGVVRADDRGLTLGDGLFETIRVAGGDPQRLSAHLERLRAGAEMLALPLPPQTRIHEALRSLIAVNRITDGVLRLTVTRGPGPRGLLPPATPTPSLLITSGPLPPMGPVRIIIATRTRINAASPLTRMKTLNRMDYVLARQEAAAAGADDAVILNGAGRIADGSIATPFAVIDGQLITPPLEEGALAGIARRALLAEGAVEQPLMLEDLAEASEVMLVNALGLRPVTALQGRAVGNGQPGPLSARLAKRLYGS